MTHLPGLGSRGQGWVLVQLVLLMAVAVAGWTLGPDVGGAASVVAMVAGVGLLVAGGVLAVLGVRDLGGALTPLPHPRDDASLVQTGVYARARHPIYGGLLLGAVGWGLVQVSVLTLGLAAVLWAFFTLKSMREEVWLVERFAGYPAYRERTRRFIPWPG